MTKDEVPKYAVDSMWKDCIFSEDLDIIQDRAVVRAVECDDGYIFIHHVICPDGEQIDAERAKAILDRKTEDSIRFLISSGRAGRYL